MLVMFLNYTIMGEALTSTSSEYLAASGLRTLTKLIGSAFIIETMPGNSRASGTISDIPLII